MDEFAKLIYEQWSREHDNRDMFLKSGDDLVNGLEGILSIDLINKFYDVFCESCQEVEERAFIEGFAYACRCLSRGKIEFGNTAVPEV